MNIIKVKRRISSSLLRISELKEFIGKHVEITVAESVPDESPSSGKVAAGILSDFKDKKKLTSEKQAWSMAARKNMEINDANIIPPYLLKLYNFSTLKTLTLLTQY